MTTSKRTPRRANIGKSKKAKAETLPKWNLTSLFLSAEDPRIARTISKAKRDAAAFRRKYAGKVAQNTRNAVSFEKMISDYEKLQLLAVKPYHYASLLFSESATQPGRGALLQKVRTEFAQISNELAFFYPELLSLDKKRLLRLSKNAKLAEFKNYITQLVAYQRHELPEREKQIFSDLALTGKSAVVRMFQEEYASREYSIRIGKREKKYTLTEALEHLHSPDRKKRIAAQKGFTEGLADDSRRIALIFNTLLQDKDIRDRYHKFSTPEQSRHLDNQISQKTVDSLARAARQSFKDVAKYYDFKRELLGYKKLYDYDRYAPVLQHKGKTSWAKAKGQVVTAFGEFHPQVGKIAQEFFVKRWIDAKARPGKRGGAFCSFVTPDLHPYVFINYSGSDRDVFTLAHELGHAIHAYLMREQRYTNFETPLTIAETASVFAELILFHSLLERTKSPQARLALTMHHIENIIATVHRQMSMFFFERDIHAARKKGELQVADFNRLWRTRQEEMFGGSVVLTDEYDFWWSYIPHFVHTPFYVYAYSFGQLFALGLYEKYLQQPEKFPEQYLDFLRAGNSKNPQELGRILGVNLSRPEIWQDGVKCFRKMIASAKKLATEI